MNEIFNAFKPISTQCHVMCTRPDSHSIGGILTRQNSSNTWIGLGLTPVSILILRARLQSSRE
jgi:hypothetical protein